MKCLVATARYILVVDTDTAIVTPIRVGEHDYYGISWFPEDHRLIVANFGAGDNPNDDFETLARSEKGYLAMGDELTAPFLSAPHQILCATDGRVICTNTGRNSIVAVDPARPNVYHEVRISDARWDRWDPAGDEGSGDHLNSVFQRGDRLYAIAHRHSRGSRLVTMSYPDLNLLSVDPIGELTGLHNVWIGDDGNGLTCASHQGGLADVRSGAIVWSSGENVYTRGLAISDDLILVGESAYASRDMRRVSISGLWIVNRHTLKTENYICLGPFGGVHEVRIVDRPDHAHHGQAFRGAPDLLLERPFEDVRQQRLRSSAIAWGRRSFWTRYRDVLGAIQTEDDDWLAESEGYTCLIAQTDDSTSGSLSFEYELADGEGGSHVAAVAGFQGAHADNQMTALLIQQFNHLATLRLWHCKDGEWTSAPEPLATDLALSGTVHVGMISGGIALRINDLEPIQIAVADLAFGQQPLGVRWSRARVRVLSSEA